MENSDPIIKAHPTDLHSVIDMVIGKQEELQSRITELETGGFIDAHPANRQCYL